MRDALRKLKPDCFEDIVAMNALYRPGPMDNIPRYINVKHGLEDPSYLHPLLESILKRDQRRHHLPGAGDGDRQAARWLHAGRRRSAATRHGQEDQGRDGRPARDVHRRCGRARDRSGPCQHDLRRGGEVRLLRLRQEPRHRLCAARLPYRLAEGEPPGRVLRGGDDHRMRQPGEARRLPAGDARPRHPALPAGRQPLARAVRGRGRGRRCGRALRAGGDQGRGCRGDRRPGRGSRAPMGHSGTCTT